MAGFLDPTDPTAGGLMSGFSNPSGSGMMGMFANPQTAALLGMAGGLLQASGPSRMPVSNGQALGAGLSGMGQGMSNAIQMQRGLMMMNAMQGLMGGGTQPGAGQTPQGTAPAQGGAPSMSTLGGPNSMLPITMGGASGGVGGAPAGSNASVAPATSAGPTLLGKSPAELMREGQLWNLISPGSGNSMIQAALSASAPTDMQKNAAAAYGYGTSGFANDLQAQEKKAGYIAPTALRSPIYIDPTTGQPTMVPTGMLQQGYGAMYGSQELAKAQNQNQQVWDPTANGGAGGFVYQTRANVNAAANGGNVPLGIQNNNFGNIRNPNGSGFQTFDTPQDGVNAADSLLATYGSKYGINTLNGIANRWSPGGDGNNNPNAKAAAMAAASGVPANQPINLADPAMRSRILPALFDTETPGWRNALTGGAASPSGAPMAAQPPLGATRAASTAQNAPAAQMEKAQGALSDADDNYQQSREVLQQMLGMARNQGVGDLIPRMLPQDMATKLSSDAATYQKLQANFIAMQGKALGNAGTDASRETLEESVPGFDKPQQAKLTGLTDQLNQLDWRHLKRQTLSPIFQSGDPKQYTQTSSSFDNTIQPSMMPQLNQYLSMPAGPTRTAALQQAITDPKMKAALDLMVQTGQLK